MTRINCIPVTDLTDQHLLIEYREITRVFKLHREERPPEPWPYRYVLGVGHVKYFYNKGRYLQQRCQDLYTECLNRNFKVQKKDYPDHSDGLNWTWTPSKEDKVTNLIRLNEKIKMRPGFYRYYGKTIPDNHYANQLRDIQTR